MTHDDLPVSRFAFPGPLRDKLVAAILSGEKTTTSCLFLEYEDRADELPNEGHRSVVVDSADRPVAVIEVMSVDVCPISEVPLRHAIDEGEGFESVAEWRAGHEEFWHSERMRDYLDRPDFTVDDGTLVVLERFQVIERTS